MISLSLSPAATWPIVIRASAAKAVTTCRADFPAARSKERRIVLPSMATTPVPSWPRSSRKLAKQVAKAAGSSSRNRREKVSWLGKPPGSSRNSRNNASRSRAKSAKSTQLSAPQIEAVNAIVSTSRSLCRRALPLRGSGSSARLDQIDSITVLQEKEDRTRIHAIEPCLPEKIPYAIRLLRRPSCDAGHAEPDHWA